MLLLLPRDAASAVVDIQDAEAMQGDETSETSTSLNMHHPQQRTESDYQEE